MIKDFDLTAYVSQEMERQTGYKFESTEQYLHWCANMVNRIYTANFTRESYRLSPSYVAKLVALAAEVSSKLDISEGYDLIKADGTNYEDE
jgi:hypothetical protein